MKTLFIAGIAMILAVPVHAQLQKGTKYVGGTISLSGQRISNKTSSGSNLFSINPSFQLGKFVKGNLLTGVDIGVNSLFKPSWQDFGNGEEKIKNNYYEFFLSPYIRNYKALNSKWAIFLTSSAQVAFLSNKVKSRTNVTDDGYLIGMKIKPGVSYWITPRFSLESDINLLSFTAGYKDFAESQSFYFRSGATSYLDGYFSVRASWYIQKL